MKIRRSKPLVFSGVIGCPLLVALIFGLLPELKTLETRMVPGEIRFANPRPGLSHVGQNPVADSAEPFRWSMDWLEEQYDELMSWDKNPWKIERNEFGHHYFTLDSSTDPADQARAKELRRLADSLYQKLLARYPELAVPFKNVPPERNGFLKLVEFSERFGKGLQLIGSGLPDELSQQSDGRSPWNPESSRAWLTREKLLMDEIRAIGLMPEQSIEGIDIDRWAFTPARFIKSCSDALMMEARLAAEDGNQAAALEAVRAANGIASHVGGVETPSLLAATVQILIQLQIQQQAISHIIPALPSGQVDVAAWEQAVNAEVSPPGEFARLMKGEWNVTARAYLLPMIMDAADPKYPPDPEALMDFHAGFFLRVVQDHEGRPLPDLPSIPVMDFGENAHLSYQSRQVAGGLGTGARSWRKGWDRKQAVSAMTQAAFSIMKGNSIPPDPIYGQPYDWDPSSRNLSPPNTEVFKNLELKPITVPKP